MPVLTRSTSNTSIGAVAQCTEPKPEPDPPVSHNLQGFLEGLDDEAVVQGHDVKLFRDATSSAIAHVWTDTQASTERLTRKINGSNVALTEKLDESFMALGQRPDNILTVAMLQQGMVQTKVAPFSGAADTDPQFAMWLRRLQDVMQLRAVPFTDEQRASFLISHLEGLARERVEELPPEDRKNFASLVSHLTSFFENPQHRDAAKQKLCSCRQEPGESVATFANRILNLVRSATSDHDATSQKDRVLDEFMARLRSDIRWWSSFSPKWRRNI